MNIITWFKGLFNQEVQGYICPRHDDNSNAINEKIIRKYNVKAIKFNIPFLDPQNHWVHLYFIPKNFQRDLDFLASLMQVLPITCIFKKRILQGFKRKDFDYVEVWSRNTFNEIKQKIYQESLIYEQEQMKIDKEKAVELAKKVETQRKAKEEEKAKKKAERERLKEEEKAKKKAEKAEKKATKKLKG